MDTDVEFGQIALKHELLTKKQHDEAWKLLEKLRKSGGAPQGAGAAKGKGKGKLKGKGKGNLRGKGSKKTPRLVDVLVQKKFLSGAQARQVENARLFRERRMQDKVYGRIAIKSKFCKAKQVEKGLTLQKEAYLAGDAPPVLATLLLDKTWLTEEQDEAIRSALGNLDVGEYMAGRRGGKGKKKAAAAPVDEGSDEESGEDLEELGSGDEASVEELEELSGLEVDLDDEEAGESLDDIDAVEELDSNIDQAISGIDVDIDLGSGSGASGSASPADVSAPHGLSSDLDVASGADLDLDDASGPGSAPSASDDLGSDLELDSDVELDLDAD